MGLCNKIIIHGMICLKISAACWIEREVYLTDYEMRNDSSMQIWLYIYLPHYLPRLNYLILLNLIHDSHHSHSKQRNVSSVVCHQRSPEAATWLAFVLRGEVLSTVLYELLLAETVVVVDVNGSERSNSLLRNILVSINWINEISEAI